MPVRLEARDTYSDIILSTVSGSLRSLYFMCRSEVERNVWMRGFLATLTASQQRLMSFSVQRARPQIWTLSPACLAMAWTESKSPWLEAGKPASMTSTPRISSW